MEEFKTIDVLIASQSRVPVGRDQKIQEASGWPLARKLRIGKAIAGAVAFLCRDGLLVLRWFLVSSLLVVLVRRRSAGFDAVSSCQAWV